MSYIQEQWLTFYLHENDKPINLAAALYAYLFFWFIPHREVAAKLHDTYEAGMKVGDVDNAMYALCFSLMFSQLGGEKLSLLSQSYKKAHKLMVLVHTLCY